MVLAFSFRGISLRFCHQAGAASSPRLEVSLLPLLPSEQGCKYFFVGSYFDRLNILCEEVCCGVCFSFSSFSGGGTSLWDIRLHVGEGVRMQIICAEEGYRFLPCASYYFHGPNGGFKLRL